MPEDRDRILGELAVEQGLLGREDADQYYAHLEATPGSPPLAKLLVQDGRATIQDLARLREIWQARGAAPPPRAPSAPAPPPPAAPPAPPAAPPSAPGGVDAD